MRHFQTLLPSFHRRDAPKSPAAVEGCLQWLDYADIAKIPHHQEIGAEQLRNAAAMFIL
ncbi:hypothetical protein SAZ10_27545 [Mesorhizobium sp. BAC0120]|uniref:hypothetical protein n=1 Tax=Mesorhizobium sp. BAC0120 TaxID=3090670 RepID=UPI00298CEA42|nr:hypothetical protein [Mesorhizobium sp. BAC0120]MDW6025522.1 hypothetical protein [Mesorhizobium sp. BAC0120]